MAYRESGDRHGELGAKNCFVEQKSFFRGSRKVEIGADSSHDFALRWTGDDYKLHFDISNTTRVA